MSGELLESSTMPLQELRKLLEKDHGEGAAASIIVQDSKGEIVYFISHTSRMELAKVLHEHAVKLGT